LTSSWFKSAISFHPYGERQGGREIKSVKVLTANIPGAIASVSIAEQRITKSHLPEPVQKTAHAQGAGTTVVGYAKHVEKGNLEYEVQLMAAGHTKDLTIDPQGNLLEVEEEVQPDALPASVLGSLRAQAGKRRITKIESLMKHGKIVAYEAEVETGEKHSEIQVGPDGQKLDHEE
jgi:hypothetical protein